MSDPRRARLIARWRRDFPIGPHGPEEAIDAMLDEIRQIQKDEAQRHMARLAPRAFRRLRARGEDQ